MYITPFFVNFFIGRAIESSLKHLAERRTDIFGVGEEAVQEAAIGMKKGEEETKRMGKCLNFLFLFFTQFYSYFFRGRKKCLGRS